MRYILSLIFLCFSFSYLMSQTPITQIEGLLEVYHTSDVNSLYIGKFAGWQSNSMAKKNTMVGANAGNDNINGSSNVFFGSAAGFFTRSGSNNVFIGSRTGFSIVEGDNNVVIGYEAGPISTEVINNPISHKLFIDNQRSDSPLIYGEFDTDRVFVHGDFKVNRTDGFNVIDVDQTSGNVVVNFGKLGIGVQPGDNKLNVNGKIYVNGTATKSTSGGWVVNSDARLKKDIVPLDSHDILHKVIRMQGVSYQWDDKETGYDRPDGVKYGFIAQDLEKVWPSKISTDQNGFLQTSYGDYDPMFVEAIKALADKNDTLESKVKFLENELQELKQLILQKDK